MNETNDKMKINWSITITKTSNGYHLKPHPSTDGRDSVIQINEEEEETKGEQLALKELCYELKDFFAVNNDKYINDDGQYFEIKVTGEK